MSDESGSECDTLTFCCSSAQD